MILYSRLSKIVTKSLLVDKVFSQRNRGTLQHVQAVQALLDASREGVKIAFFLTKDLKMRKFPFLVRKNYNSAKTKVSSSEDRTVAAAFLVSYSTF